MSPFEGILAAADVNFDALFGEDEGFAFQPMLDPVHGRAVEEDPARTPIAKLAGIFDAQAERIDDSGATARVQTRPMLSVRESLLLQGTRRPDRFTRIRTGTVYEVVVARPDGMGRIEIDLKERPR